MSRLVTRRVAALISALALLAGGAAVATSATATTTAGGCCSSTRRIRCIGAYTWVLQHRGKRSLGREREGDGPYAYPLPAVCH